MTHYLLWEVLPAFVGGVLGGFAVAGAQLLRCWWDER